MADHRLQVNLPVLDELRRFHLEAHARFPRSSDPGLSGVGLIGLDEDMLSRDWRYESFTPLNCRAFATTGGNGVHFSLLVRDGLIDDRSPVIVTIPGMIGDSFVLGEGLFDFLCLGKDRGYFALEQLSYNLELTLEVYTNSDWQPQDPHHYWIGFGTDDYEEQILALMKLRLGLIDWGQPEKFNRLQAEYQPLLIYPPGHWGSA